MIRNFYIWVLFFILIPSACKKDSFDFPYVPIRLELGIYSDLAQLGPGLSMYKDGYGIKGLIIYRDYDNSYYVFDRACPYEKAFNCAVNKDPGFDIRMECPCCKSQYLLGDYADPIKGPSSHPLRRYNAYVQGDLLKIIN